MAPPKKKRKRSSDRVTLDDIARYCNVSKATVSRVLNDKLNEFPVSDTMIERVRGAAQQLGYRPNRLAKAVRSQRTNLIGLSLLHQEQQQFSPDRMAYENQIMGQFANAILSHPGFEDYDLVVREGFFVELELPHAPVERIEGVQVVAEALLREELLMLEMLRTEEHALGPGHGVQALRGHCRSFLGPATDPVAEA